MTDPTDPNHPGLYAITFDAVVTDYDTQQTITTVGGNTEVGEDVDAVVAASASITTEGSLKDGSDEYIAGQIKATIQDNIRDTYGNVDGTPEDTTYQNYQKSLSAKLYTVTSDDEKLQPINEKTVEQTIKNGGNGSPYKILIGSTNQYMTVIAASGSYSAGAITWSAEAGKVYAVEFTWTDDQSKTHKAYKVVRVAQASGAAAKRIAISD